ncbi:MFS transporter, partial [Nostoc sp. NIES-2111]
LLAITKVQAWGTLPVAGLALAAIVLAAAFVMRERRTATPLLNLHLFRSAAFSGGTVAVLLSYAMLYGMFFAMSFALVRGFGDSPLAAGLHLAIVPVALGLVAPFAGGWADRRPRSVMLTGMALCLVALAPLWAGLSAGSGGMPLSMAALAIYGAGLGCFIAPNNAATLKAAPADHAGQAGGLLNLMRAFGTAAGIAAMSSVLAWRIAVAAGEVKATHLLPPPVLLGAVRESLVLLAVFAVLAAAAAWLQGRAAPPVPAAKQA